MVVQEFPEKRRVEPPDVAADGAAAERAATPDAIGTVPRGQVKGFLRGVRDRIASTVESDTEVVNEELTPLDTQFTIVSPPTTEIDITSEDYIAGVRRAAVDFNDLLANHTGRDADTGIPFIKPEETKSAEDFAVEILEKGQDRVLVLLKDNTGKVIDGVYGPLYTVSDAKGKKTMYATLEYQGSEASNHGLGFGSTAFELYRAKLIEIARKRKVEFGGILIEAVATAGAYWEYVGAKSPYLIDGDKAIKTDYAMPQLNFDPETGEPLSTDVLRENIKLIPSIPGRSTITVGQWRKIVTTFYETSYMPKRERFGSDAAWETAKASVNRTLQEICLSQFDGFPDDTVLHLKFDRELRGQKGFKVIRPWLSAEEDLAD